MSITTYEEQLTGGHPNSLGNTVEVFEDVLKNPSQLAALFDCFFSKDEVVRMRVANAIKRIAREDKNMLLPYIDRFLSEISLIDQASTKWSLAQLFLILDSDMNNSQLGKAKAVLVNNLNTHSDWIVLNMTMETLGKWAKKDDVLKRDIRDRIFQLKDDPRKSVSKKASKTAALLF